jgi:hypothetical protein
MRRHHRQDPHGKVCAGKLTLTVSGHTLGATFGFTLGKIDRIAIRLPSRSSPPRPPRIANIAS